MKRIISIALILCSLKCISIYAQAIRMYSTAKIICEAKEISYDVPLEENVSIPYDVSLEKNVSIPYNVPLDEIAEKLNHVYAYDNMVPLKTEAWWSVEYLYGELGALPEGEDVLISVYAVKGNRLLFLPEDKANTEILLNGTPCKMYYSEKEEGYLFYALIDWQLVDDGVPVNYCEGYYDYGIKSCIVGVKEVPEPHVINYYYQADYQYGINDLEKLGEVRVSFNPNATIELPEIPIDGNLYVDAILEYMADAIRKKRQYGSYDVYLETYGRLHGKYGEGTYGQITGVITGNGLEEYFFFEISDGWGYIDKECVFPTFYSGPVDESIYFVNHGHMANKPDDLVQRIIGLQREAIHLEVAKEAEEETKAAKSDITDCNSDIDFRTMNAEEALGWINYVYSHGECFGMNELGYQEGELRGYCGDDILMYTRNNTGDTIYFIPKSMTNTTIVGENGQEYRVYVNKDGNVKFYCLERNRYADKDGQLMTKLFTECYLSTEAVKDSVLVGEGKLQLLELSLLDVPEVAEDEYVTATKEYIEDILKQNEKSGRYEMYIGEYEALFMNEVCLSVALLNEDEAYYFRYMIVKNGEENYYFWPVGFGLDGSLEECEADRHYMNKVCIERTKQLRRSEIVIDFT